MPNKLSCCLLLFVPSKATRLPSACHLYQYIRFRVSAVLLRRTFLHTTLSFFFRQSRLHIASVVLPWLFLLSAVVVSVIIKRAIHTTSNSVCSKRQRTPASFRKHGYASMLRHSLGNTGHSLHLDPLFERENSRFCIEHGAFLVIIVVVVTIQDKRMTSRKQTLFPLNKQGTTLSSHANSTIYDERTKM